MAPRRLPKGLDTIRRNLNREVARIGGATDRGLVTFGLLVRKGAQENAPVRLGNLRGSAYVANKAGGHVNIGPFRGDASGTVAELTRSEQQVARGLSLALDKRRKHNVAVGFGAPYAAAVHENPNAGAPGYEPEVDTPDKTAKEVHSKVGGWKYLERSLQDNASRLLVTLANEIKR